MNVVLPFTKRTTAAVTVFTCIFAAQKAQALTSNPTLLGALNTEYVQLFDVYKWLCHQDVPNQAARLDRAIARASVLINELYATVLEIVSTKQNHVRLSIIQTEVAAAVQVMVNLMSLQPVTSVFGRTGAVTAQFGDYSFPQISGLLPQSQLATPTPAWINVKTYGATGNTQENATASTTENLPIITCAGAFAPADVGKRIYVVGNAGVVILPTTTIIGFVNSSSVTVAGAGPTSSQSDVTVVWGTDDTTAIKAAVTAAGTSGTVYVPLGAYLFNPGATGLFDINGGPFRIIGDGMAQTVFHPDPSGTYPSNTNLGFFFESSGTSANDIILADFTIDGVLASIPTSTAINISGNGTLYNVAITGLRSASVGIFLTGNSTIIVYFYQPTPNKLFLIFGKLMLKNTND